MLFEYKAQFQRCESVFAPLLYEYALKCSLLVTRFLTLRFADGPSCHWFLERQALRIQGTTLTLRFGSGPSCDKVLNRHAARIQGATLTLRFALVLLPI